MFHAPSSENKQSGNLARTRPAPEKTQAIHPRLGAAPGRAAILQRSIGNQAVLRTLDQRVRNPSAGPGGAGLLKPPPTHFTVPPRINRKCAACAEEEAKEPQIKPTEAAASAAPIEVEVIRPPASSRIAAALSTVGEEVAGDEEDAITAQTPGGPVVTAPPGSPAATCNYEITYANERKAGCDGGRCGAQIVFDITEVKATGAGCPASLDGLRLTEVVTNDHGCSPANVQGGAGCPIKGGPPIAPGHGRIQDCTDTYGVCLGSTSQSKIPPGGCTETVTQQLFIDGVLAETHLIRFPIKKTASGCAGTVNRT